MYKKFVFVNGRVHTPLGIKEALAIEGGCITALGTSSDVLFRAAGAAGTGTEVIDLKGCAVLPGFGDSHMHFISWADSQEILDLKNCQSIKELREDLGTYVASHPISSDAWYRGRGWNHTRMAEGRMPTRHDIDDLCPDKPIILTRICGHVAVLNTAALQAAGVTSDTRVEGGVIELGEDEEPNGILAEEAISYVSRQIPKRQDDDMRYLLEKYGPQAASFGLTQLNTDDLKMFGMDFRRMIKLYTDVEKDGKLPFRVRQQFMLPRRELLLDFLSEGWRTGGGTPL